MATNPLQLLFHSFYVYHVFGWRCQRCCGNLRMQHFFCVIVMRTHYQQRVAKMRTCMQLFVPYFRVRFETSGCCCIITHFSHATCHPILLASMPNFVKQIVATIRSLLPCLLVGIMGASWQPAHATISLMMWFSVDSQQCVVATCTCRSWFIWI